MKQNHHQFENPEFNQLLAIILSLGNEFYILKDRMTIIEKLLESKSYISRKDIDLYRPTTEEEAKSRKGCDEFMERLFRLSTMSM